MLENSPDRVYAEWDNKGVGLVSCGVDGGVCAVAALRPVLSALQLAGVDAWREARLRQSPVLIGFNPPTPIGGGRLRKPDQPTQASRVRCLHCSFG